MIERLAHEDGISAVMNTHYPTNALAVSDNALMMNRSGTFFCGPTEQILTENNISRSFDVEVVVNEFQYRNRSIKNIIPVSLLGHAI